MSEIDAEVGWAEDAVCDAMASLEQPSTRLDPGDFPQNPLRSRPDWLRGATTHRHRLMTTPNPLARFLPTYDDSSALTSGFTRPLSVFRLVAIAWAITGLLLSQEFLEEPLAAAIVLTVMGLMTAMVTPLPGRQPLLPPDRISTLLLELSIGAGALIADGFVYQDARPQSLPWAWPAAGVMLAGILLGPRAGFSAAVAIGGASLITEEVLLDRDDSLVSAFSKIGLWIIAGTLAGYLVQRLRRAEEEISLARAREQFSRELHDGVLQTLAVIQRRSDDAELAALARDQEHDLRSFISGGADAASALPFEPSIRSLAARHERLYPGCIVNVVIANDLPELHSDHVDALSGAVGEALTNAGKHGEATKITVYAEPTEDSFQQIPDEAGSATVFVSVKDNGTGFDPQTATERIGLSGSIRGRLSDAGGHADVMSAVGRGTEVTLWL